MQKTIDSGIYLLVLESNEDFYISNKNFTNYKFKKGFYYYVGSAQRNLTARIQRHLKEEKKIKWHIDFLTTNKNIKIIDVICFENETKEFECILSLKIENQIRNIEIIENFGNSDCKICKTHLYYTQKRHTRELIKLKKHKKV